MFWLTIFKHSIPYIWDILIKNYDEDGNPVLWSKTMIFGTLIVLLALYYNLYTFIHTNTEKEHALNLKNKEEIRLLIEKNNSLEEYVSSLEEKLKDIIIERDALRHESLKTKSELSEIRLDVIQLKEQLNLCNKVKSSNTTSSSNSNIDSSNRKSLKSEKSNKADAINAILKGKTK